MRVQITIGARETFFYRASVVTDVDQDAEIVQSDLFGPVGSVQRSYGKDVSSCSIVEYTIVNHVMAT